VRVPGRVLIDTNVAIYLAANKPVVVSYRPHLQGNVLALSFASAAELLLTARKAPRPTATLEYWREKLPYYVILFPDLETCDIWAEITADCHRRGRPRQDNDLWVAATALRYDLPLVTHNRRDFEDIPGLTVISEAPTS
jgi:tRNA(fMet)-specific endonuclease VapC